MAESVVREWCSVALPSHHSYDDGALAEMSLGRAAIHHSLAVHIQRQVGHDLLQSTGLVLELLQPLHLGRQQACGYGLYRQIVDTEHHCEVVSSAQTPRKPGDQIKTDRRSRLPSRVT